MEPYTLSNHNDGGDIDSALEAIGAGYREPIKDRVEAILDILTKAEKEAELESFFDNLVTVYERQIYLEAEDKKYDYD